MPVLSSPVLARSGQSGPVRQLQFWQVLPVQLVHPSPGRPVQSVQACRPVRRILSSPSAPNSASTTVQSRRLGFGGTPSIGAEQSQIHCRLRVVVQGPLGSIVAQAHDASAPNSLMLSSIIAVVFSDDLPCSGQGPTNFSRIMSRKLLRDIVFEPLSKLF